ncbi:MAG: heparan N-sulfatase [Planctomycetota bacterium]|nr:MAG: heparan N-sulfatase [Planctomycetota bacterium]
MRLVIWFLLTLIFPGVILPVQAAEPAGRPNILFAIADDWGRHAGAYGTPEARTPNFDRLAREGVLFDRAYCTSPSCTPSRGAILTGQWHWRLEGAANLHCVFPNKFRTFPEILAAEGYACGLTSKGWGPGKTETPGRELAGPRFPDFEAFLKSRNPGQPFCFWLGSVDPHRPFDEGTGKQAGYDLDKIQVPAAFPEVERVRSDIADYLFEVERFDRTVGRALAALEAIGQLDQTIVIMTSDHGMAFPRGKSNLYDLGTNVPFVVRWPGVVSPGRTSSDFISLQDVAPTLLEAVGGDVPADMTGRSLMPLLQSDKSGAIDPTRDSVLVGKERHVPSQPAPDLGGYPSRALRTGRYLYVRNYRPDRWPNGTGDFENSAVPGVWYGDTDNGATKTYLIQNRDRDAAHRQAYDLAFAKRPAEELYILENDPEQMTNVASEPQYAEVKRQLAEQLAQQLEASGDPRSHGAGDDFFEKYPYLGDGPKAPGWKGK